MPFSFTKHPTSLCETCDNLIRIVDADGSVVKNACNAFHGPPVSVPFIVKECSSWRFAYAEAPHGMYRMAWLVTRDKKRQFIGFQSPEERRKNRPASDEDVDE